MAILRLVRGAIPPVAPRTGAAVILRPYQQAAIDRCRELVAAGQRRICLVAPCGAGKGTILAALMGSALARGRRVLAIAHRRELVEDLAQRVHRLTGVPPGLVLPSHPASGSHVQVGSIQTLGRRVLPAADLVLADECHHATAESWRAVLDHYPEAVLIGSTATPCRLSGAPLGDLFTAIVEVALPGQLVEDGHLVPVTGYVYDAPDLRGVRRAAGDYAAGDLATTMDRPAVRGRVVDEYLRRAPDSRAIVFATGLEHSRALRDEFLGRGVLARHVDGETPRVEREAAFQDFREGRFQILCNIQLFTEGVDLPCIETVILARPTLSLSLALQMVGRGGRPIPCVCGRIPHWRDATCGCDAVVRKRAVRIHDHAGVILQHGLPHEPRRWSLDADYRVSSKAKATPATALRTCESCFGVYLASDPACPLCGHRNQRRVRLTRNAEGVAVALEDLEAARRPKPKPDLSKAERYYRELVALAAERGYKPGYVGMRFKGRYGFWPRVEWMR